MLSDATLFFFVLVPGVVCTSFLEPHLTKFVYKAGYHGAFIGLYMMSVVHLLAGLYLLVILTPFDLENWRSSPNTWTSVGATTFLLFLALRYAQLASWCRKQA